MNHEKMMSHAQNNHLYCDHHENDDNDNYLLQIARNSKTKRVNRNDTMQWSPLWGPPL